MGIFFRFYRFPELVNFSLEQALAFDLAGLMVKTGKIALIGVEYFIRQTSSGHSFFNSAFYLYPISVMQYLFGFDPVVITALFTILNILSGIGVYFYVKKLYGNSAATISLTLFLFSPTMVSISRTVWHVYLLIPITVLVCITATKIKERINSATILFLGFLLGLGLGIHISYAIFLLFCFLYLAKYLHTKNKLIHIFYFIIGIGLGNLPAIIFDLRHNFYNLQTTLTFLFEGLIKRESGFSFESYHFIYLLVPIYIWCGKLMSKLFDPKTITILLMLYILVSSQQWNLFTKYPTGMAMGANVNTLKEISKIIVGDSTSEFEVASIIDGQTRAENLRYILKYVDNKPAMGYEKYPEANTLYVISYTNQSILEKNVWEINSVSPAKITHEWKINDLLKLSKIERI